MEIRTKEISGIASAVYDMRKPMESKGDSIFAFTEEGLKLIELGKDDKRLLKQLSSAKNGSGHDCVLKDIHVHMDITSTHDFLLQLYRYHFRDTASSTSKMHCIHKGDISDKCTDWVSPRTIELINSLIEVYNEKDFDYANDSYLIGRDILNWIELTSRDAKIPTNKKELFECIIHNTPIGYQLTVAETTNYLQLKSMWNQREKHKMPMWNTIFVEWVKTLPYNYLITGDIDG